MGHDEFIRIYSSDGRKDEKYSLQSFEIDMHILSISLSLPTCEPRQKICVLFMQTKSIVMRTDDDTLKACGDFVATANIN